MVEIVPCASVEERILEDSYNRCVEFARAVGKFTIYQSPKHVTI
jgi:hypothetical protein